MTDSIPTDAERLLALDYIKSERTPSELVPGAFQFKPVFVCPSCKSRRPVPPSCQPFACNCGLTVQPEGVYLFAWRAEPVTG